MAKDDMNKDKEQDDFFGDGEDFGLPELDYEALDDDDSDDATQEEISTEDDSDADFQEEESVSMEDDSVFESESMDTDDTDEAIDEFYEEESFDDFATSSEGDDDITDSVFDSDALDEDEFAQFENTESDSAADIPSSQDDEPHSGSKSKFAKVVIFGILIFAGLGAIFWWMTSIEDGDEVDKKPVAEKVAEPVVKKPEEKPEEDEAINDEVESTESTKPEIVQPKTPAKKATNATPSPVTENSGTVNLLTARPGNAFIVIGSFVNGDRARDYANKLARQGKSLSIIPPFGKAITHRLAIASYPTFAEAKGALAGFRSEYGQDIWILKY